MTESFRSASCGAAFLVVTGLSGLGSFAQAQYFNAETGLHYNGARYYDPKTGRYLSSDPIGLKGGMNTYAYVYNNPLSFIDSSGLGTFPCPAGVSTSPNCTIYDPNTPDTVIDQRQEQNNGKHCASIECTIYNSTKQETYTTQISPRPPDNPYPIPPTQSCEDKCKKFLHTCYATASGAGVGAGAATQRVCKITTQGRLVCTAAGAVMGGTAGRQLETECIVGYSQCTKKCKDDNCPKQ